MHSLLLLRQRSLDELEIADMFKVPNRDHPDQRAQSEPSLTVPNYKFSKAYKDRPKSRGASAKTLLERRSCDGSRKVGGN